MGMSGRGRGERERVEDRNKRNECGGGHSEVIKIYSLRVVEMNDYDVIGK